MKNLIILLFAVCSLGACNTTKPPLYYYGSYNQAVYQYFQADTVNVNDQISLLEQSIQEADARGMRVAPGLHAHLGMLYFEIGNTELGLGHFEQEKALFPESVAYIDFLINSSTGAAM